MVKLTDDRVNNLPHDRLSSEQSLTKDQFVIARGGEPRVPRRYFSFFLLCHPFQNKPIFLRRLWVFSGFRTPLTCERRNETEGMGIMAARRHVSARGVAPAAAAMRVATSGGDDGGRPQVGCTTRGSVGRRLEARAGSAGPRPRVHGRVRTEAKRRRRRRRRRER